MSNLLPKPVFIVGGARSGTTLLFEILSASPDLWSAYRELHGPYEWEIGLHPDLRRGESNALNASHATPARIETLRSRIARAVSNGERLGFPSDRYPRAALALRRGLRVANLALRQPARMVDKNPKHCFRIPFLRAVFPDAVFVMLCRGPRGSIHSLLEGWRSGRYRTYDVRDRNAALATWAFDLPPDWSKWVHAPLEKICARQWVGYYQAILDAGAALPRSSFVCCRYEDLIARPYEETARIFEFLGLPLRGPAARRALAPPVTNSITWPSADKWRKLEDELDAVAPIFDPMRVRLGYNTHDRASEREWLAPSTALTTGSATAARASARSGR